MQQAGSGDEHDEEPHEAHDHHRSEVRLHHYWSRQNSYDDGGAERAALEQLDPVARLVLPDGHDDDHRQLRQLAWLQAHRTDAEPAMRTVNRAREQYRYQKREDDCEEGPRQELVVAPFVVVEPGHRNDHQNPDDKVLELAAHEEVCVAVVVAYSVRLACA